jgi:hypothetical protein
MAQHIPIHLFDNARMRTIRRGIVTAFDKSRGYMKTSMRYIYQTDERNKNHEFDEVYLTERQIPTGIVHGENRGTFEIHFNSATQEVEHIYLVA